MNSNFTKNLTANSISSNKIIQIQFEKISFQAINKKYFCFKNLKNFSKISKIFQKFLKVEKKCENF
jgi:hypothetical protein